MADSPASSTPLSGADSFWLRMDDPTNLMMITGIMLFDERIDLARLRAMAHRRIEPVTRFRQRVVISPGGTAHWQDDPHFDIARHVVPAHLPGAGGDEELRALVGETMSRPMDFDLPLWKFYLVDNYKNGSALVGQFHHCMGDGIGLMMLLLAMTDLEHDGDLIEAADPTAARNPFVDLFLSGGRSIEAARKQVEALMPEGMKLLLKPVEALARINPLTRVAASAVALATLTFRTRDNKTLFNDELHVAKRAAWSKAISMEKVLGLRGVMPGTVNDILLTAMSGGLRRYILGREGEAGCRDFRATVPVNLRPLANMGGLGNEFGLVYLSLPLEIADPVARLRELQRRMNALKSSAEPPVSLGVIRLMGKLPAIAQRGLVKMFASKATAVVTNVPGPIRELYMAGKPLRDMIFWVPRSARLSLGVSILSYAGRVRMGVATDAGLVPDPEKIVEGFEREFETMLALEERAQSSPANRASP